MRKLCFFLALCTAIHTYSQQVTTPDVIWGKLFEEVQLKRIFKDNKTFVDAIPRFSREVILEKYNQQKGRDTFDLLSFVQTNFIVPSPSSAKVKEGLSLKDHLEELWEVLQRQADIKQPNSSLLPLPKSYIVPGGALPRNLLLGQLLYHAGPDGKQTLFPYREHARQL